MDSLSFVAATGEPQLRSVHQTPPGSDLVVAWPPPHARQARRLRRAGDRDDDPNAVAEAFVEFFAAVSVPHFREEEEEMLFPLIERLAADRLERAGPPLDGGPIWGQAPDDLNATLLAWGAGDGPGEHVNDERDVLIFLVDGSAKITVDGEARDLRRGEELIVAKGRRREITAGRGGTRYLSVHLRRRPLQIQPHLSRHGSKGGD